MKNAILTAVLSALVLVSAPAFAQPTPGTKPMAPNVQEFDKQMAQVQENMKTMQEQMDKIRQTQDPQARQKLLQDHWVTMQSNMQLMHGMWGPDGGMGCYMGGPGMGHGMMMGPMMGWGRMDGYYSKLTPEQQRQRQYMMDRYMSTQQMMMDHMMQHNQWMWQPPK